MGQTIIGDFSEEIRVGQEKVYYFLKANEKISHSIPDLANDLEMQESQVSKYLNKMLKWPRIYPKLHKHYVKRPNKGFQRRHLVNYVYLQ